MTDLKIGLALGSGGARGLAHIGVIWALEENGIPIHCVSGSSIGAVVGALYSAGIPTERMIEFASEFGEKSITTWIDPTFFKTGGFLKGNKVEQLLKNFVGEVDFKRLKLPFYVVATDLLKGAEVVISKGDLMHAVHASSAIPGIFSPVLSNGQWLVDGALTAPVPTRILQENGCNVIIASNVYSPSRTKQAGGQGENPELFQVLMQSLYVMQQGLITSCMKMAHVAIVPNVASFDWIDFSYHHELVRAGYKSTIEKIPEIKKLLSQKGYRQ